MVLSVQRMKNPNVGFMFGIIHYGGKETILQPIFILKANFWR